MEGITLPGSWMGQGMVESVGDMGGCEEETGIDIKIKLFIN